MKPISQYLEDVAPGDRSKHMELIDLNVEKEVRVAVVGPQGQFNVVRTGPNHKGSTAGVVFWSEELRAPVIPPRFQEIQPDGLPAHVFYLKGCQRFDTMDKYEQWKLIDDDQQRHRQRGLPLPRYTGMEPEDLYPKWVLERRRAWRSGRRDVDLKALLKNRMAASSEEREAIKSLNLED